MIPFDTHSPVAGAPTGVSSTPAITVVPADRVPRRRGFRFGWLATILVFAAMAGTPVVIALIVVLGH